MIKRFTALSVATVAAFAVLAAPGTGMVPTAVTVKGDCARVASADRKLCKQVQAQHAYGWTDESGNPQTWVPNGKALVKEITHQGLTKAEMHAYLTGERLNYREHVIAITFNMDKIVKECGDTDGYGYVQLIDEDGKPGGRKYTWATILCD